ncbi:MAG: hypothetical protein ACOCY1_00385 [Halovenus sp.]
MKRTEKLSTSVTPEEQSKFRVEAAQRDQQMAELLRDLVYDFLEEEGHETSREGAQEGNQTPAATAD